jgi:hypothetical protein
MVSLSRDACIGLAVAVAVIALGVAAVYWSGADTPKATITRAYGGLKWLRLAIGEYQKDHNGALPASLQALDPKYIDLDTDLLFEGARDEGVQAYEYDPKTVEPTGSLATLRFSVRGTDYEFVLRADGEVLRVSP